LSLVTIPVHPQIVLGDFVQKFTHSLHNTRKR
jgi:hypothetical protein